MGLKRLLLLGLGMLSWSAMSWSDVVFDGSTGQSGSVPGPTFEIAEDRGSISGGTLVHSFSEFSINDGESARFLARDSINAVVSRVTGSSATTINGVVEAFTDDTADFASTADFYFLNPNGVIFGTDARIDLAGALRIITEPAPDISSVNAFGGPSDANNATLTIADPERLTFIFDEASSSDVTALVTQKCSAAKLTDRSSFVVREDKPMTKAPTSYELAKMGAESSNGDGEVELNLIASCF